MYKQNFNFVLEPVTLNGKRIRLEPLVPSIHAEELFEASHATLETRNVFEYLPYGPSNNFKDFMKLLNDINQDKHTLLFCIIDVASDKKIGVVGYLDTQPTHKKVEIGHIWITPSFQRTYANTETNFLLLQYAFESLQYIRVTWKCDARNVNSRKAAERLGFRYEGTLRNHLLIRKIVNGIEIVHKRDSDYLSIIDSEWNGVMEDLLNKLK
ncbi:2505_t:CDS:2 [Funneliformis caledonium]|uniref:2505_t:CDS:1 n=1 Tax=Funneliformis caledonium TaxID=1117310 RepID=A0A9N8VB11_9GLOM|nr:2505_t:CDS:2 [Funneliformis caledonium]